MAYRNRLAQHIVLMALVFGWVSSVAQAEQSSAQGSPTQQSLLMNEPPLTNFEKMELHQRRYTSAANNVAQLFKQLNQKAQEVVLAARTAEAKDNSQNRRQLELKMRQLDNASSTYAIQYSQLQAQMQNEYRNYMALSNDLKERYAMAKEVKGETRDAPDVKPKAGKNKDQKKESKDSKESKTKEVRATGEGRNIKAKEGRTAEAARVASSPAKDPRVMDLDTGQVRARRDGLKEPGAAGLPAATSGPTLNVVQ